MTELTKRCSNCNHFKPVTLYSSLLGTFGQCNWVNMNRELSCTVIYTYENNGDDCEVHTPVIVETSND